MRGSVAGVASMLGLQIAWFLAALLLASAAHKLADFGRARRAAAALGAPAAAAGAAAAAAGLAETLAASLLLLSSHRLAGAMLAIGIWTTYFTAIRRTLRLGRTDVDCGCSFGGGDAPLGRFQLLRPLVLAALGVLAAATAADPAAAAAAPGAGMAASLALGALCLLALYAALDNVLSLRPLRAGESR